MSSPEAAEAPGEEPAPPVPTGGAASCEGFKNQTGVTDDVIRIANVADISGPVPGLFQAAKYAMDAFIAYFNSSADLCGRKLELLALDTGTSASGDQTSYATACESAFASVGSMSAFDSGGAGTAEDCGIPDLRSMVLNESRLACTTCFATQPLRVGQFPSALADFYMRTEPEATKKAAFIYLSAGAAADAAKTQFTAMEKRGMRFVYTQSMDISEFNYAPYVRAMIDRGVEWVQFLGSSENAIRLRQAMAEQKFEAVFILDGTAYQDAYLDAGGNNVEGSVIGINWPMFDEAAQHPELLNYLRWLEVVHPGAQPSMYGVFAWSAARLFVTTAAELGGKLDRASMVSELKRVRNWTSEGLHAPTQVGSKDAPACWRFIRAEAGRWRPYGPTKYVCGPLIYP
ncbi:MAG: ABC transporter substrate-binding protein [Nocardioides sp.]